MEYTQKMLETYIERIMTDRFASDVAIDNNEAKIKNLESEGKGIAKNLKRYRENLATFEEKKKQGIKNKEDREQNKQLIEIVRGNITKAENEYIANVGKIDQHQKNVELYKEFLQSADESIEIARSKVAK